MLVIGQLFYLLLNFISIVIISLNYYEFMTQIKIDTHAF